MNVLSIDPGSKWCGTSILEVNNGGRIKVLYVETINVEKQLKLCNNIVTLYGIKYAKQYVVANQVSKLITHYGVPYVCSEAPYFNPKRPIAFESLIGVLSVIRHTIHTDHYGCLFETVDPSSVKNAFGVHGGSKDKNDMTKALKKQNFLWAEDIDIDALDEHSVDSIAVGYAKCKDLITF